MRNQKAQPPRLGGRSRFCTGKEIIDGKCIFPIAECRLIRGEELPNLPGILAELRKAGVVAKDRSVRPLYRDVFLSAFRETPEGVVLASPFAPCDEAEAAIVRTHITVCEERLIRFARKLGYKRPPEEGSHGF